MVILMSLKPFLSGSLLLLYTKPLGALMLKSASLVIVHVPSPLLMAPVISSWFNTSCGTLPKLTTS
ncbi:Uncharacterised protein [Vibrio cholerae]|nr:Uncharacterised protein [Vibrio cholerae]